MMPYAFGRILARSIWPLRFTFSTAIATWRELAFKSLSRRRLCRTIQIYFNSGLKSTKFRDVGSRPPQVWKERRRWILGIQRFLIAWLLTMDFFGVIETTSGSWIG